MARKTPSWEQIASFYAGRPMSLSYDLGNGLMGGTYGNGQMQLSPTIKGFLDNFLKYQKDADKGPVLGTLGLTTLLHEAIHNRQGMPGAGLLNATDEQQAPYFGAELLGDMLPRFFGIGRGSSLWEKYMFAARNNPYYKAAVATGSIPKNAQELYWKLATSGEDDWIGPRLR